MSVNTDAAPATVTRDDLDQVLLKFAAGRRSAIGGSGSHRILLAHCRTTITARAAFFAGVSVLNLTDRIAEPMDRNPLSGEGDARIVKPLTDFIGIPLPGRTGLFPFRWTGSPALEMQP